MYVAVKVLCSVLQRSVLIMPRYYYYNYNNYYLLEKDTLQRATITELITAYATSVKNKSESMTSIFRDVNQ